jgi:ABC-type lipoprotein release transport system permease subunit
MKTFVKENWYKMMVGSSMMMASFGFMIYAVSPAYSNSEKTEINNRDTSNNQKIIQVPVNDDGSVNIKLSEEQIKEIRESKGNSTYTDFVVVGGKVYGLESGKSGYYNHHWDQCW